MKKYFIRNEKISTERKNIYFAVCCRPSWVDFDWESSGGASVTAMSGLVPGPTQTSMRLQVSCDWWRASHVTMVCTVQCLPLASLVLAMGNPTVHYFSLDIEGAELQVSGIDN